MKHIKSNTYQKQINNGDAYYLIRWSNYYNYEKFDIVRKAPNFAGIYLIAYQKGESLIKPFYIGFTWVNSLMYELKLLLDEGRTHNKSVTRVLDARTCFYKYVIVEHYNDLLDLFEACKSYYKNQGIVFKNNRNVTSGRYHDIFIKDYAEMIKP